MHCKLFIFLFITYHFSSVIAQVTPIELDSLKRELSTTTNEEKIVDLLNAISYNYYRFDEDSTKLYAEKAMVISQQIGYKLGLAEAYKNISIALAGEDNKFEATFNYLHRAKQLARSLKNKRLEVVCNNNIALLHIRDRNFEPALTYLTNARNLAEVHLDKADRMHTLLSGNLGQCYNYLHDYKKANKYLSQALDKADLHRQEDLKLVFLPDYIYSQYKTGIIQNPFVAYKEVLALQEKRKDVKSKILSLTYQTQILLEQRKIDEAIEVAQNGYELSEGITYYYRAELGNLLSQAYLQKENYEQANKYSQEIYTTLKERHVTGYLLNALTTMTLVEEKKENYQLASQLKSEYIRLSEELINTSKERIIKDLEYRVEDQRQQRKLLNLENQKSNQRKLIIFLSIAALTLLGIFFWIYNLYDQKRRTAYLLAHKNKDLELAELNLNKKNIELQKYIESNIQLENFAYIASHDLKHPLRTILNFVGLFDSLKKDQLDHEGRIFFNFIKDASVRLNRLIDDLLAYSIIGTTVQLEWVDTHRLLQEVVDSLQVQIKEKQAQIVIGDLPMLKGYKSDLVSLFQNIIINALKYSKKDVSPIIEINASKEKDGWLFSIKDNGQGFDPTLNSKIFSIFQRLENAQGIEGTGIGLARCKKIVSLHNGEIWADSVPNQGSTFFFSINKLLQS